MRKIYLIFFLLLLVSCGSEKNKSSIEDLFIIELKSSLNETNVISNTYLEFKNNNEVFSPLQIAVDSTGRLIVPDGENRNIHLIQKEGSVIARNGGNGRGPGEFNTINNLFVNENNQLYVIDRMLKRVSMFGIQERDLAYKKSFSLESIEDLRMHAIFSHGNGFWGVFNRVDDYQTGKNSFHLYKLNEELKPTDHLLEMPGIEKIPMSRGMFIEQPLGTSTFWDFHNNWFYYATSDKMQITKVNLNSGEKETKSFYKSMDRLNTSSTREYFKQRLAPVIKSVPEIDEAILEQKTIPKLDGFIVEDNCIIFKTFYAGANKGLLLISDKKIENVNFIETPTHYRAYSIRNQTLYGIDFSISGEPKIMLMEIDKNFK